MPEILRRLHEDHANNLRLLAMLEWQADAMKRGQAPDWDIVQGVIQYFLTYPDLRHHPVENQILARLRAKHPAEAKPFFGLETEHHELSAKLRQMSAATLFLLQDALMAKGAYLDLLRDFAAEQRDHIRREEEGFLPVTSHLLDASDWQALDAQLPKIADPLGDPADHRFQALRWQLATWDEADRLERKAGGTKPGAANEQPAIGGGSVPRHPKP